MSIRTEGLTKLYYSIGEVAEIFDVSTSLIRYWESEFPSLKPHKNSKGDRRFTVKNIEQLDQIYRLVKEEGYTLDGAKKAISGAQAHKKQLNAVLKDLKTLRSTLVQLREGLVD